MPGALPGCNDAACCDLVCSLDPFCCMVAWDQACADLATTLCTPCPACFGSTVPEGEPCGVNSLNPGCDVLGGAFSQLPSGVDVCGRLWADSGQHDTDWYEIPVYDPDGDGFTEMAITFGAGAPATLELFDGPCSALVPVWSTSANCLAGSSQLVCLPAPAVYKAKVALVAFVGYECFAPLGPEYVLGASVYSNTACTGGGCTVPCPPGALNEGEPCGFDSNGGCNMASPSFTPIACGDTICGTAWADAGVRDTDWYELTVAQTCSISFSIQTSFPALVGVIDNNGSGSCVGATGLNPYAQVPACSSTTLSAVLTAGTWWLFVAPDTFNGMPCGSGLNDYVIDVSCACGGCPLPCPPNALNEGEPCGLDLNGGCNMTSPSFRTIACGDTICGTAWADANTRDTDWYQLTLSGTCSITLSLETQFPAVFGIVANNGSGSCSGGAGVSPYAQVPACPPAPATITATLGPGTWWIIVAPDVFNGMPCGSGMNNYVLSLTCPPPNPPTNVLASPAAICAGQSSTLSGTVGPGATLEWFVGPGPCGNTLVATGPTFNVSPGTTTTYYAKATNGCGGSTCVPVTVTVLSQPAAPTSVGASPATICVGSSSALTGTVGAGETLEWRTGPGPCGNTVAGTGSPLVVSPTTTTTYYAVATNGACDSPCVPVTVTVLSQPAAPTAVGASPSTICVGSSSSLTANVGVGATLKWLTGPGPCGSTVAGAGSPLVVSPTTTTTYYAIATNGACDSTCVPVTVTVNASVPNAPTGVAATPSTICVGSSSALTGTVGAGETLEWRTGPGPCGNTVVGTGSPLVVSPTSTMTYYAVATNSCGPSVTCASVTVTVDSPPVAPTSASASQSTICVGQSTTLTAFGGSGTTLEWFTGSCNGTLVGIGNGLSVAPTSPTTYFVRWKNTCGTSGCAAVTVTVDTPPVAPTAASANPSTICVTTPTAVTLTAVGGTGTTLQWYSGSCGAAGTPVGTGPIYVIPAAQAPTATTTYYALWHNACGDSGCASVTVTVDSPPSVPTNATATPSAICVGASSVLSATTSGATLEWREGSCAGPLVPGGASPTVSPTMTTTYYASATNACGPSVCAPVTVTVSVPPTAPTSATANPQTLCQGQVPTVTLTAVGGSGGFVEWFDGSCGGTSVGTGISLVLPAPNATTTYFARRVDPICGASPCTSTTVTVTPPPPCGCGNPPTQTTWWPDNDGDGCGDMNGTPIAQCANLPAPTSVSTCTGVTATHPYVTNNLDSCDCIPGGCLTGCSFIPVGTKSRLYTITGPPNGTGWSWEIVSPDFGGNVVVGCCVPGVTTTTFALAQAFANSINAMAATLTCNPTTQLSAVAIPAAASLPNTAYLTVRVGDASGTVTNPAWALGVAPCGGPTPTNPWCFALTFGTTIITCQFNPTMVEVPASGFDCNGNGVDDAFDIVLGTSLDVNGDGIPDECQPCMSDLDHDGMVGPTDLGILLGQWGTAGAADFNGSGVVDAPDLGILLGAWGPC
ncbi:MAG: hypothetical protein U0572_14420 [Phycisphaerales bacterium]